MYKAALSLAVVLACQASAFACDPPRQLQYSYGCSGGMTYGYAPQVQQFAAPSCQQAPVQRFADPPLPPPPDVVPQSPCQQSYGAQVQLSSGYAAQTQFSGYAAQVFVPRVFLAPRVFVRPFFAPRVFVGGGFYGGFAGPRVGFGFRRPVVVIR